jgi:hypothetical protein
VEALRWSLTDAEVIQAIHRLRLADRTRETAPIIHLLGTTDHGLPVTEWRHWEDADKSALDFMLAEGVVVSSTDELRRILPAGMVADGDRQVRREAAKSGGSKPQARTAQLR